MMKDELTNMMAIIPDDLKADVYARLKSLIASMVTDIHIDIEKLEYADSAQSSMDKISSMNSIMQICSRDVNIPVEMLWSTKRNKEFVTLRQMLMWIFRTEYPQLPLRMIGDMFKRDHATILHSIRSVEGGISTDPTFRGLLYHTIDLIQMHHFDMSNSLHKFEKLKQKALVK
jgi:chromosomal replication initiation ATPase DnaA